ncbi:prolyl oligopeptidase family protein (macronuclear) [Tetrahymena thermophila SB210]|uniref:Prolyl oligopeptidase family protein n=1 Tax=Tetrahymena thermophila (strain SB210) TaxID=312017 RepID=Q239B5_TETTS|nr:prolyl oligopeptidase family protein [Tetrahymena thermophila SB210]EAR93055.1 prolyl oligopeptidase family protein [Tetrahymena thermophila SB210]|eukprot:XP_001013300.1 prolyl oligopeptidase family protein [Tetrahymena thermophila SB210]
MSSISQNQIDSERVKLILSFLEKVHLNSHQIDQVEVISDNTLRLDWYQYNQRYHTRNAFSNYYQFNHEKSQIGNKINDFPILRKTNISSKSPQNTYKVVIQDVEDKAKTKQILEVYQNEDIVSQLNLSSFHKDILNDASISSTISWNRLETKFLYMAQVNESTTKSFFEVENEKDLADAFENFKFVQDFGENMDNFNKVHLFEYDVEKKTLNEIKIPDNIFPCYPQYLDDKGEQIVLQGYKIHPEFKYAIQVINRYIDIYYISKIQRIQLYPKLNNDQTKQNEQNDQFDCKVISVDEISLKPNVSYDGKKIAYFGSPFNPTHFNYFSLKIINTEDWQIEEILLIKNENLADKGEFMGVCNYSKDLKNSFWINDNIHYVFSSLIGHSTSSYIVNTKTKKIAKFKENKILSEEFIVSHYNPRYNTLFASYVSIYEPKCIAYLKNFNLIGDVEEIVHKSEWQYISLTSNTSSIFSKLRNFALNFIEEQVIQSGDAQGCLLRVKKFNRDQIPSELAQLFNNNDKLNPLNYKDEDRPLIVDLHGGPHATYGGEFALINLYYLLQGYVLLLPNFTGSAGFGQDFINKLLKNIGKVDSNEVVGMIDKVIDMKICNKNKVVISGGSYGGYLAAMIASQHSEKFNCCVICNAVLNFPFSLNSSDIPEWSLAECLGTEMNWNLTGDDYKLMFEQSPMSLINKVTTLNLVGVKDKRVPYQQSIAFHAQNVFNKNKIETYLFSEEGHSLVDHTHPHFEALIKQITFIESNLLQKSI